MATVVGAQVVRVSDEPASRRAHNADPSSFETAYPALFLPAMRIAYRITGDRTAAEDIAAEAMARTYARWRKVATMPHRDAWVMRVASNLALDVVRRRRPAFEAARRAATVDGSDDFDENTAVRLALTTALDNLPRRQREALVLHYFSGLTDVEISASLGISASSVRTHLQRGIDALRRRLEFDPEELGRGAR